MSDDLFDVFNEELITTDARTVPHDPLLPSTESRQVETDNTYLISTAANTADTQRDILSGDSGAHPSASARNDVALLEGHLGVAPPELCDRAFLRKENAQRPAPSLATTPGAMHIKETPQQEQQRLRAHAAISAPMAPPPPLPLTPSATTLTSGFNSGSSNSSSGAVMIIRSSPATDARGGDGAGTTASSSSRARQPASAVLTEAHSGIRVRRTTAFFEELSVRLAEFPFVSLAQFRRAARHNGAQTPVAQTCVGVVIRKSDPKRSTTHACASRYAVFSLWSMASVSPSPETEVSFLLCGDAFDLLYSQLVRGSVIALSNVAMCSRKRNSSTSGSAADPDVLLRVADHTAVRQLGFAADLGTCTSISAKSNERCRAAVNTRLSQHCSYHVSDLRKVARGTASGALSNSAATTRSVTSAASPTPTMKGGALTSHMTLTPAPAHAALRPSTAPPSLHGNAGRAASQQLLRQPSFFAVRGATGLPVEDAARRRGLASAGTGVYGGVHTGAPLPLKQQVGLRPAERYPSAQELGVTSRGRDVLEAARQQAVLNEEEKLLRRSLRPIASQTVSSPANNGAFRPILSASASTVTTSIISSSSNINSTRAREREPNSISSVDGVPVDKRIRTDAPSASSAASASPANTTAASVEAQRVEALRAQFQPLHRGTPPAFTPLSGHGSIHAVLPSATQKDYRHTVVISAGGGHDAQTALLRAAARAAKDVSNAEKSGRSCRAVAAASADPALSEGQGKSSEESLALTLLGAVANHVQSQHDHLRSEADKQRLASFVDRQITREKALQALEAISQQEIKAYYCYDCRCWYAKPPTTCVEQHHRTELKPALKKYVKCEHCNYKTFVVGGEDAKGWMVFPRCPRCHEESVWVRGDAAPQIAGSVEEPTPF